jgi:predicted O-methyltransferase YrrM
MINDHTIYDSIDLLPADVGGWNSDSPVFEDLIVKYKPKVIVEVGTWKGASAINMANIIKKHGMSTRIFCIDTWLGALEFWTNLSNTEERNLMLKNGYPQIYYQFLSNVVHANVKDVITPIPLPSDIAHSVLKYHNIKADVIYIDASHEYEDVLRDIGNYKNILNDKGVMFGDDFNDGWPGVKRAVHESFDQSYSVAYNNFWIYES